MAEHENITERNLDRLNEFLQLELEGAGLAQNIPSGAHLFHGSHADSAFTATNLRLATKILLGMSLGYVDEAPLIMVFEYKPGEHTVIDLSTTSLKHRAQELLENIQDQSHQEVKEKISGLLAA